MRVRLVEDPAEWGDVVATTLRGGLLQSYEWGEFKALLGWRPIRVLLEEGSRPLAGAQLLLRRSPLGAVAYVPRGPLADPTDRAVVNQLWAALHREARRAGAFFLKVEPDWPHSSALATAMVRYGFRSGASVQPRSTIVVDLAATPEELYARLSRRARYNVRLAERHGLRCREGGDADLPQFYRLLVATACRGRFYVHPEGYYRELWRRFSATGAAHLLLVSLGQEALAATMFLTASGVAYQLYSGSSADQRRLKPNDLLQWQALLRARAVGCHAYDMWGIPDEIGRAILGAGAGARPGPEEREVAGTFEGVYLFKRNFGGAVARTVGAFDYAYSPARYWLWRSFLPAVGRLRELAAQHGATRSGPPAVRPNLEAHET